MNILYIIVTVKKKIRAEYADKIDGYFFDNLIHMSNNEEKMEKTRSVVDKYSKYTVGDYIREVMRVFYKILNLIK